MSEQAAAQIIVTLKHDGSIDLQPLPNAPAPTIFQMQVIVLQIQNHILASQVNPQFKRIDGRLKALESDVSAPKFDNSEWSELDTDPGIKRPDASNADR
jgi:hypothetical protein